MPDSPHFVDAEDSYVPNPFTVRLTCVNNGNTPTHDITGTLILPPNVELVDSGISLTRHFDPPVLGKWRIGDPVPELTWVVRWVPRLRYEAQPKFRFTVAGKYLDSLRLDSAEVRCQTRIPGLVPMFGGCMKIPDSLGLNAAGTDVTPNPFTVRYPVRNVSHIAGGLRRVYLSFPSDGLTLNPSSPWPINSSLDTLIAPGDSIVFEWVIDVANRITRRNVLIQAVVIDDEGNPITCEDWLPIANLRTGLGEMLTSDVNTLRYDPVGDTYDPEEFTVTATLRNTGGANLSDVIAELEWTDASGQDLIEFDPEYGGDNTNPKTLGVLIPQQDAEFVWGFRLKNRNTTGVTQYVVLTVNYGTKETPFIEMGGCEVTVEIDPVATTAIGDLSSPADFILLPNHPNPFTAQTTIRFSLPYAAPVTLTVIDALGREVRRLLNGAYRPQGTHTSALDGGGMLPGIYFLRMTVGTAVQSRRMILVR
jgi:hypothetical protein